MRKLPKFEDKNLLIGFDTSDDACVYQINEHQAMIQTVDFFPPVVDDPYVYGQIAAANSLSDVYAMGGAPTLAMNLLCVPNCLPKSAIEGILLGGHDKVKEAGAIIAGGHTIEDVEPKYGLCVTGFIHPKDVLANSSSREGDILILTKPLGTGILTTAAKADLLSAQDYDLMVSVMATLNKYAQQVLSKVGGAHACTDVTGFGMLGHSFEMAAGSSKTIRLFSKELPLIPAAVEMARMGIIPAGAYTNFDYLKDKVSIGSGVSREVLDILSDPQTSGGLLISVPEHKAQEMLRAMEEITPWARIVGQVEAKSKHAIIVD